MSAAKRMPDGTFVYDEPVLAQIVETLPKRKAGIGSQIWIEGFKKNCGCSGEICYLFSFVKNNPVIEELYRDVWGLKERSFRIL